MENLSRFWRVMKEARIKSRLPLEPEPSTEQARTLAFAVRGGSEDAVFSLYRGFLYLVPRIACQLTRSRHELSFLVECGAGCLAGAIGLYEPEDKGDENRDMSFSAHALRHIYFGIKQAMLMWDFLNPPPDFKTQRAVALSKEELDAISMDDIEMIYKISDQLGVTVGRARRILRAHQHDSARTVAFAEDALRVALSWTRSPDIELVDQVEKAGRSHPLEQAWHSPELSPEEAVLAAEQYRAVCNMLATLTPREEKVLRMRFGIGERSDHTLEEIGQDFEVTCMRIRQIEAKALRKMRHPKRSNFLLLFAENTGSIPTIRDKEVATALVARGKREAND